MNGELVFKSARLVLRVKRAKTSGLLRPGNSVRGIICCWIAHSRLNLSTVPCV